MPNECAGVVPPANIAKVQCLPRRETPNCRHNRCKAKPGTNEASVLKDTSNRRSKGGDRHLKASARCPKKALVKKLASSKTLNVGARGQFHIPMGRPEGGGAIRPGPSPLDGHQRRTSRKPVS